MKNPIKERYVMKTLKRTTTLLFALLFTILSCKVVADPVNPKRLEIPSPSDRLSQVIQLSTMVPISVEKAFALFTTQEGLTAWFAPIADVKAEVGGAFEMYFDPNDTNHNNSKGCKITALVPNKLLAFDWKGPRQFEHFMDNADPMPQVVVSFIPCDMKNSCTEIQLFHSGFYSSWRSTPTWQGPRDWFEPVWKEALEMLRETSTKGKRWFK
jgi:uncharacterized protein YndB with AHSA1/START domain